MSLQENILSEVSLADIKELILSLPEESLRELSVIFSKKKHDEFLDKIEPLPNLAHNEFKVFDEREVDKVTEKVMEIRRRRYIIFVYYSSHFDSRDDQVINFIRQFFPTKISYVQAYRDLHKIKQVLGSLPKMRRELIRYQVIEMQRNAYQLAERNQDPMAMARAADGITRAAQLDKDITEIPWEELIPPALEPTSDLEALGEGFEKKMNLEAEIVKMKKRFGDVEDTEEV